MQTVYVEVNGDDKRSSSLEVMASSTEGQHTSHPLLKKIDTDLQGS